MFLRNPENHASMKVGMATGIVSTIEGSDVSNMFHALYLNLG